jgi:cysteine desulfurase
VLLMRLDLVGVCASIGSACASGASRASPTLEAMRVPSPWRKSVVRFSFGATTTDQEVADAAGRVAAIVADLRRHG